MKDKQQFKVDDCEYCACLTHFEAKSISEAISLIEDGGVGCENCGVGEHKMFNVYWKNYCNGNWELIRECPFKRIKRVKKNQSSKVEPAKKKESNFFLDWSKAIEEGI